MTEEAWTPLTDLEDLEPEFQEEKIKKAIWELGSSLNSFPLLFYRTFWPVVVKGDLKPMQDEIVERQD